MLIKYDKTNNQVSKINFQRLSHSAPAMTSIKGARFPCKIKNTLDTKAISKGIDMGSLKIKTANNSIQLTITKIGKK